MDETLISMIDQWKETNDLIKIEQTRFVIADYLEDNLFPNTSQWIKNWQIHLFKQGPVEQHYPYQVFHSTELIVSFTTEAGAIEYIHKRCISLLEAMKQLCLVERK